MALNDPLTLVSLHVLGIGVELYTTKVGVPPDHAREYVLEVQALVWSRSWSWGGKPS